MAATEAFEKDIIPTSLGDLEITFLGHGTLMMTLTNQVLHIDPFSKVADYSILPSADLILLTHEHRDHLDPEALELIQTETTTLIGSASCIEQLGHGIFMVNGDVQAFHGIKIEAVPAYNIAHLRETGEPFHPEGIGNGYVLTFGDTRIYVAGDTENIPEMDELQEIDIAFLPMNLPYTMTPEMVANAARTIRPAVLYPYHFGNTDTSKLTALLSGEGDIQVRIRRMA